MLSLIKLKPKRFGDRKLKGLKRDSQLPYLNTFKGVIFMKKLILVVILIFFVLVRDDNVNHTRNSSYWILYLVITIQLFLNFKQIYFII